MKYRINEHPKGKSIVPIIELIPDNVGKIEWVGIYDDHSVIHGS